MARASCNRREPHYQHTTHDTIARYRPSRCQKISYSIATILFVLSTLLVETKAQIQDDTFQTIERRSLSVAPAPSGYQATYEPPGGKTQLSIGLARVKNPDEEEESYDGKGYMKKKKKKFPITWLRNQYPFNSYYNRKKRPQQAAASYPADLSGQYSSQSYDVLDPNPSTWVRIPDRTTASIKFHKQSQGPIMPADINAFQPNPYAMAPPLPPPMSLLPQPTSELDSFPINGMLPQPPFNLPGQQTQISMRPHPFSMHMPPQASKAGGLMTSESQDSYSPQKAAASGAAAAVASAGPGAESGGFGGISLSFGNGRSISFGGGKGLTIGGKAGAIEIGRNGGGISIGSGNSDNQPAASGYSETTKGGASHASSYANQAAGYSSSGYGNEYVNKYPIMSVDVPRRGKKIIHANADMAPKKFRIHSSPRVKITTGSRDPLEKPSDEELTEEEEDIFEPPVPFPKKNATMNETEGAMGNGTHDSLNMTNTNGTQPMQLYQLQQNGYNYNQQQQFNQEHEQFSNYQHVEQQSHQQYYPAKSYLQQQRFNYPPQQHAHYDENVRGVHIPLGGSGGGYNQHTPHTVHHPQYNQHVPFDEPPHFVQKPADMMQPSKMPQMNDENQMMLQPQAPLMNEVNQTTEQTEAPMSQQAQMNEANQMMLKGGDDQRPAVNQWRQFSREARPHINQQVPKQQDHAGPDANPIFYNGGHPNSIAGSPPAEARDSVDVAASSQSGAYAKTPSALPSAQHRFSQPIATDFAHKQFNPTTVYQVVPPKGPPQQKQMINGPGQPAQIVNRLPLGSKQAAPNHQGARQETQQNLQQEGSYYAPQTAHSQAGYYHQQQQGGYKHHEQEQGYKTYTIGSGGISTEYSSGNSAGKSYPPGGSGYGYGQGYGRPVLVSSDGFDRKHYDAKIEQFDPEAHDKRERSKVILFLKPRISIHMANSSTTTKRPKNQQHLVHVINRPIFLNNVTMTNSTNATHHEEEFIDPDLAEPMDVYQYGYGYGYGHGHGYTKGYKIKTTSTTKKPKRRTTTTTTTTPAPTTSSETESTTTASSSSSGETEGTTTPASSTTGSSEETSSTSIKTGPSSSSTTEPSTTSTTENGSSANSEAEVETSSSTPSSSISSTEETSEKAASSTPSPAEDTSSSSGSPEEIAEDLVSSATEEAPVVTVATSSAPPTTTTTTTTTSTTTTTTTTPRPPTKTRVVQRAKSTTTSTSTTTTTTTTTTSTTPEPTTTTTTEPPPSSTTEEATTTSTEPPTTTTTEPPTTTTTSTTNAPTSTSEEPSTTTEPTATTAFNEDESSNASDTGFSTTSTTSEPSESLNESSEIQQEQQTKRSLPSSSSESKPLSPRSLNHKVSDHQHQPMLLNDDLIEKLMRNKTLVGLMSSQLKRVIPSEKLDESEKQRIVRQVFEQMMEKKVDFSMNNVRLAVKTVSSSYKAAAEKSQRVKPKVVHPGQKSSSAGTADVSEAKETKKQSRRHNVDSKGPFGRRATNTGEQTSNGSRSAPVIDTALKLASRRQAASTERKESRTSSSAGSKQVDSNGNPIVVVLLPTGKAK